MDELRVKSWRRRGQDRLYVNRVADDVTVAWYDGKAGRLVPVLDGYRDAALEALAPYLVCGSTSRAGELGPWEAPIVPAAADDLATVRAGDALRRQIQTLEPSRVKRWMARHSKRQHELARWEVGLKGERIVGSRLKRLEAAGWQALHSIELSNGSDLDHLLIGPGGVFVVNTKHHRGASVWVGDRAVTVNGRNDHYVRNSLFEAERATRLLSRLCPFAVEVRPVLAVVGARSIRGGSTSPVVAVIDGSRADAWFGALPAVLAPGRVTVVYGHARDRRPWLRA